MVKTASAVVAFLLVVCLAVLLSAFRGEILR